MRTVSDDFVAPSGRPLAWPWVWLLIAIGCVPSWIVVSGSDTYNVGSYDTDTSDGLIFRASVERLLNGESPYDVDGRIAHISRTRLSGAAPPYDLPFAYGPNALPLFAVYGIGSPRTAYTVFVMLGAVLLMWASAAWLARWESPPVDQALSILAVGCSAAHLFSVFLGQTGAFIGAAVLGFAATYQRRPLLAGVLLGLAAVKPQYALFMGILPLVDRQWTTVLWSGITFIGCCVVSALWFGLSMWPEFIRAATAPNHTIADMCNWFVIPGKLSPAIYTWIQVLGIPVMLTGAVALGVLLLRMRRQERSTLACMCAACALSVLLSPNTHPYDLTLWTLPLCLVARDWLRIPMWPLLGVAGTLFYYIYLPRWPLGLLSIVLVVLCLRRPRPQCLAIDDRLPMPS